MSGPPPRQAFEKIAATFGHPLPEEMVRFYSDLNGLELSWSTAAMGVDGMVGRISILDVERAFGGEGARLRVDWDHHVAKGLLWNDELKASRPDDYAALRSKRVFDLHLGTHVVAVEPRPGGATFYEVIDGAAIRLDTTFERLLDTIFETAGAEYYPGLLRADVAEAAKAELRAKIDAAIPARSFDL